MVDGTRSMSVIDLKQTCFSGKPEKKIVDSGFSEFLPGVLTKLLQKFLVQQWVAGFAGVGISIAIDMVMTAKQLH